jgi:hypothetical protein
VSKSSCSPQTVMMQVRTRWKPLFNNTPHSLPVFTLANDQRVLRDRLYAEAVADRLIEFLFDIDSYRGTGRQYLPS